MGAYCCTLIAANGAWKTNPLFDGPGLEGSAREARDDLLTLPTDLLLDTHPMPAPSLRLFSFRFPVHNYLLDVREERQPALPPPGRSFVAVARRNYRVTIHHLSPAQYAFLQRLDGRRSVRLAYDEAIRAGNLPPSPAVPIADWLRVWIRNSFFECRSADGCRNR